MKVHLIHGIHSSHGGNTARLAPFFITAGFSVLVRSYGWATALMAFDWLNKRRAKKLAAAINDGDVLVCHSNGGVVGYFIQKHHRKLSVLILINPALDDDLEFLNTEQVVCLHNAGDDVVGLSALLPLRAWGSMGRGGYQGRRGNVINIDCAEPPPFSLPSLWGHSALFEPENLPAWGPYVANLVVRITRH